MDELIKNITQQANISPEQAKTAVDSVLNFLKDKLPAPVVDQIKAALSGQQIDTSGITTALGGLLGGKQ
jgi:nucleoid DNA-binding protein